MDGGQFALPLPVSHIMLFLLIPLPETNSNQTNNQPYNQPTLQRTSAGFHGPEALAEHASYPDFPASSNLSVHVSTLGGLTNNLSLNFQVSVLDLYFPHTFPHLC